MAIIVLTGHGSLETAIEGMRYNIFDYMLKTSEPVKVVERVKAALQHHAQETRRKALLDVVGAAVQELRGSGAAGQGAEPGGQAQTERVIVVGGLQLDTWRQVATLNGRTLALTPTEFRVLLCLAEHVGTMLSYGQLVKCAQGYEASDLEAGELIKPHIHHLRQKLEPDPSAPRYILNVRGKGYLLSVASEGA
jgi:DNA-binding response OmpR family regulator